MLPRLHTDRLAVHLAASTPEPPQRPRRDGQRFELCATRALLLIALAALIAIWLSSCASLPLSLVGSAATALGDWHPLAADPPKPQ